MCKPAFFATAMTIALVSAAAAEDTCATVQSELPDQLTDRLSFAVSRLTVVKMDTLKTIVASSADGDMPGYECLGVADVWKENESSPSKVTFIYTVINVNRIGGLAVDASMVGISHICGTSADRDNVYSGCKIR
jgi:hypothetical protein